MTDDPRTWLNEHIEAGFNLREEARTKLDPGPAWERRADEWIGDLVSGVKDRSPRHVSKVRTVGDVVPENLRARHVWYDKRASGLNLTSTGEGLPGNNPLSRLSARIRRAEEVAALWEHDPPKVSDQTEKPPPLKVRAAEWAQRMGFRANHEVAVQIAKDEKAKGGAWEVDLATIKREASNDPKYVSKRRKSG